MRLLGITSRTYFYGAQGQGTPRYIAGAGENSNSSEILYLSSLPASLLVLITCKFDGHPIKYEGVIMSLFFLHYKSMSVLLDNGE